MIEEESSRYRRRGRVCQDLQVVVTSALEQWIQSDIHLGQALPPTLLCSYTNLSTDPWLHLDSNHGDSACSLQLGRPRAGCPCEWTRIFIFG